MVNAVACLLFTGSTFLLNPPTTATWRFAELEGGFVDGRPEVPVIKALTVLADQVATASLSDTQRDVYDEVAERFEEEYEAASQNDRAALLLELLQVGGANNRRHVEQIWVEIDGMMVHSLFVLDGPSGNHVVKLEDEVSGQYAAVVLERSGEIDLMNLMGQFLEAGFSKDELKAAYVDAMREDGGTTPGVNKEAVEFFRKFKEDVEEANASIEVNGVVRYLDVDPRGGASQAAKAMAEMWSDLPQNDGRRRIETAIAVVRRLAEHEKAAGETGTAGWIFRLNPVFDGVSGDSATIEAVSVTDYRKGGGMSSFEAPPGDLLDDFFGEGDLPLPNPAWSWKRLKKELL